jgi:hypothetical protein
VWAARGLWEEWRCAAAISLSLDWFSAQRQPHIDKISLRAQLLTQGRPGRRIPRGSAQWNMSPTVTPCSSPCRTAEKTWQRPPSLRRAAPGSPASYNTHKHRRTQSRVKRRLEKERERERERERRRCAVDVGCRRLIHSPSTQFGHGDVTGEQQTSSSLLSCAHLGSLEDVKTKKRTEGGGRGRNKAGKRGRGRRRKLCTQKI